MSLAWSGPVIRLTKAQVSMRSCSPVDSTNRIGWYDLYDTDTAMDIVYAQQQMIAGWIRWTESNVTHHT
jgi:hypothetical protein